MRERDEIARGRERDERDERKICGREIRERDAGERVRDTAEIGVLSE